MEQTEIKSSNSLRYKVSKTKGNRTIYVSIRLDDECKNGHQDFAITGDLYEADKPKIDKYCLGGGCIHDDIMKFFPEFKQFIDLHLCDYKGIPMHAVANGYYHLRQGFNKEKPDSPEFKPAYCDYYRVTPEQFDKLNDCVNELQFALALQNLGILAQWEAEANKAIAKLEELTGTKFIVDSVKTQYYGPTPEKIAEEEKRQRQGYYTPEAAAKREQEKAAAIIAELKQQRYAKIEKATRDANNEYEIKRQVLEIGGVAALKNALWYEHSQTLGFNWRGSDMMTKTETDRILAALVVPEGITVQDQRKD